MHIWIKIRILLQKEIPLIVRQWRKKEIAQCARIYVGDHPYVTFYQILSSFDPLSIFYIPKQNCQFLSLWLQVDKVLQKLTKSYKSELRHLFQCCILIPRKCLFKTPFQHTVPPPSDFQTVLRPCYVPGSSWFSEMTHTQFWNRDKMTSGKEHQLCFLFTTFTFLSDIYYR